MSNDSGATQAAHSFDPFGRATKLEGAVDPDFGFAGMYVHSRSGLNLTAFRAYSAALGRWSSRDPIGEAGGTNAYFYGVNNPLSFVDPLGLDVWIETSAGFPEAAFHESINVGDPFGDYYSQSFGLDPFTGRSEVYTDPMHGGRLEDYAKTDAVQDKAIIEELKKEVGKKMPYGLENNCRSYSRKKFDELLEKYGLRRSPAPSRAVDPYSYTQFLPISVTSTMTTMGRGSSSRR